MLQGQLSDDLIDAIPDGLLVVDAAGHIRYANRRLFDLSGYQPDELVGRPVEGLIPEATRRGHESERARYAEAGHPVRAMGVDLDTRLLRKDGSTLAVDIALSPLRSGTDELVVTTIRDATVRRHLDADRQETQRRLTELVENVELLVVGLDVDGRVFYVNPYFTELTGEPAEEAVGSDWFERFTLEKDTAEVRRVFRRLLLEGEGQSYHENRIRSRRGRPPTIGWFNIRLLEADGQVSGSLSIGQDLTSRLHSEERLRAVNRVRQAILETETHPEDVFRSVAREARTLTESDLALVVSATDSGFVVRAADGEDLTGTSLPRPPWNEAFAVRQVTSFEAAATLLPARYGESLGAAVVVPPAKVASRVLLFVARPTGAPPFDDHDVATLEQLSGLATVATEFRTTQQRLRDLAVYEDRERIAREMHDLVIQRLFAAGLSLQVVGQEIRDRPDVAERLSAVVVGLDEAIRELRSSIFSLQAHRRVRLQDRVLEAVEEVSASLGFAPEVSVDAAREEVSEDAADHLVATLREALTNVARHARASHAQVLVKAGSDLVLVVEDDGRGLPEETVHGRGLANMAERARRLGGKFDLDGGDEGGVRLHWRVPLGR